MVKRMSAREARANFAELLSMVRYTKEPVIVEEHGKPYAVLVSPEQYDAFAKAAERTWHLIDQMRKRNTDKDPDAILASVTAEVERVREELRATEKGG